MRLIYKLMMENCFFKQNSIEKIDDVDLAIVKFESEKSYDIAQIGNVNNLLMGDKIFVGGYPL